MRADFTQSMELRQILERKIYDVTTFGYKATTFIRVTVLCTCDQNMVWSNCVNLLMSDISVAKEWPMTNKTRCFFATTNE